MPNKHQIPPSPVVVTADALRRSQLATEQLIQAAGASGVLQFNGRSGDVSLTASDVNIAIGATGGTDFYRKDGTWAPASGGGTGVTDGDKGQIIVSGGGTVWMLDAGAAAANLGFTPYNVSNPAGYISSITGAMVTTALTYTPTSITGLTGVRTVAEVKTELGLSGTNTGDQTTITGNAGSATVLQTPRNINGVAFDGSAAIEIDSFAKTSGTGIVAASFTNKSTAGTTTKYTLAEWVGFDTSGIAKRAGTVKFDPLDTNWVGSKATIEVRRSDAAVPALTLLGTGSPEGAVAAPVGALFTRDDGGVGTTLYYKATGTSNTGWVAVAAGGTGTVTGVTGTAPIQSSGGAAPAISISAATTGAAGSMSAADKAKLDGVAAGATANTGTVTGVTGTAPIVSSGGAAPAISISAATTGAAGSMSAADKAKLDGVAAGATADTKATIDAKIGATGGTDFYRKDGTWAPASGGGGVSTSAANTWTAVQSFALSGSTGVTPTSRANTSTASATTKTIMDEFVGFDTVGTPKQVAAIVVTPKDVNWVGSIFQIMARSSDVVVPFFTANFPGSPEGVLTAHNGAICLSDNTYLYKKSGGTGNTGWIVIG